MIDTLRSAEANFQTKSNGSQDGQMSNQSQSAFTSQKDAEDNSSLKTPIIKVKKVKPIIGITNININQSNHQNIKDITDDKHKHKHVSRDEVYDMIDQAEKELESATFYLSEARQIAKRYGLTVDSSILNPAYQTPLIPSNKIPQNIQNSNEDGQSQHNNANNNSTSTSTSTLTSTSPMRTSADTEHSDDAMNEHQTNHNHNHNHKRTTLLPNIPHILSTTGGHSNTDHLVLNTGHAKLDRFNELKRNLKRRARAMQPECKGEDRWDQPRFPGQGLRRRRITREADLPSAPPEPPMSGYVLFVAQMTAKIKHDRRQRNPKINVNVNINNYNYNYQHDQIKVVREISKIWRYGMKSEEKQYYLDFAMSAKLEYNHQIREFRATGGYTPSSTFMKLGDGPWVRKVWHEKNELERELATYPMDIFKFKPDFRLKAYRHLHNNNNDNDDNHDNHDDDMNTDPDENEHDIIAYDCRKKLDYNHNHDTNTNTSGKNRKDSDNWDNDDQSHASDERDEEYQPQDKEDKSNDDE